MRISFFQETLKPKVYEKAEKSNQVNKIAGIVMPFIDFRKQMAKYTWPLNRRWKSLFAVRTF